MEDLVFIHFVSFISAISLIAVLPNPFRHKGPG